MIQSFNKLIDCFHDPIMQHVLGGSLHKNNTSCLLLGLYHASVNWLSIVLMQIPPKMNCIMGSVKKANSPGWAPTWRPETNRNISHWVLPQKRKFISWGTQKQYSTTFSKARTVQMAKFIEISLEISHFLTNQNQESIRN